MSDEESELDFNAGYDYLGKNTYENIVELMGEDAVGDMVRNIGVLVGAGRVSQDVMNYFRDNIKNARSLEDLEDIADLIKSRIGIILLIESDQTDDNNITGLKILGETRYDDLYLLVREELLLSEEVMRELIVNIAIVFTERGNEVSNRYLARLDDALADGDTDEVEKILNDMKNGENEEEQATGYTDTFSQGSGGFNFDDREESGGFNFGQYNQPIPPIPPRGLDPSIIIKNETMPEATTNDLVSQYLEDVSGPIWQRIVREEEKYWSLVTNANNQQARPDFNNPVGGLIDITDRIPELYSQFHRPPRVENWLIGEGVSDRIEESTTVDGDPKMPPIPEYDVAKIEEYFIPNTEVISESETEPIIIDYRNLMAIAGGFPLHIVTGAKSNDEDLFLIIPNAREDPDLGLWKTYIKSYIKKKLGKGSIVVTDHSVTLYPEEGVRGIPDKIQIILRIYHSLTEVLMGFDIGACGVGIYKGRLYATERALYEIVNRTIMVSMNRASTSYAYRLIKYALKGFGLYVEGVQSLKIQPIEYFKAKMTTDEFGHPVVASNQNPPFPSVLETIDLYVRYEGWPSETVNGKRTRIYLKLPIGMKYDYSQTSHAGSKDIIDYERIRYDDARISISDIDDLPEIMYINPFRQGSLAFNPTIESLSDWAGSSSEVVTENREVVIPNLAVPLSLVRLHRLNRVH